MSSGFDALAGGSTKPSGGGSGFDSLGGGTTTKAAAQAKASGLFGHSGGILGDIDSAVGGVGHGLGQVGLAVYNFDKAAVNTGRQFAEHPIYTAEHPLSVPLYTQVAKPIGESYRYKYGPIFSHPLEAKSYHRAEADPFGTALDALTVATIPFTAGESSVARGALLAERLGAIDEGSNFARLGEALRPGEESPAALRAAGHERLARMAEARLPLQREVPLPGGGVDAEGRPLTSPYTLEAAKTPFGRVLQRNIAGLRENPRIAELPGIGAAKFPVKQGVEAMRNARLGEAQLYHQHERALTTLSRAEHQALHIAAEAPRVGVDGVATDPAIWRAQREAFYRDQLDTVKRERPNDRGVIADLQGQIDKLGGSSPKMAAKIDKVLTSPSPKFLRAYGLAREIDERSAKNFGVDAETRLARAEAPGDVMAGMRYEPGGAERISSFDKFATDRAAMTKEAKVAERKLAQAQRRYTSLQERERIYRAAGGARHARALRALTDARQALDEARTGSRFIGEGPERIPGVTPARTIRTEGEFVGPTAGPKTPMVVHVDVPNPSIDRETALYDAKMNRLYRGQGTHLDVAKAAGLADTPWWQHMEQVDINPGYPGDLYNPAHPRHWNVPFSTPDAEGLGRKLQQVENIHVRTGDTRAMMEPATAIHPFGDQFRFPHMGPQIKTNAGFSTARAGMPLGDIKTPDALKHFEGIRMQVGRLATSPSAWTRDGLASTRYGLAHDYQAWLKDHAVRIPPDGRIREGWRRFEPTSAKTSKAVRERTDLHETALTSKEHADQLQEMVREVLPAKDAPGPATWMVPDRYARAMEQEFQRSHAMVVRFFDKPLDLWRAAVLKYRPAWLVNNILGQHILSVIAMNPQSIFHFIRALRLEKGDDAAKNFVLRAVRLPTYRMQRRGMFEAAGIHGLGISTTHGTLGEMDKMVGTWRGEQKEAHPSAYTAAATAGNAVTALGRFNVKANQLIADDWMRFAKGTELARNPATLRRAQRAARVTAKEMGKSVSVFKRFRGVSDEEAVNALTDSEKTRVLNGVNRVLGNFNSLSPVERGVLRRIMPFYAWFKVIGAITKDMVVHNPERVNWVRNLIVAAQANPGIVPDGAMPSWLQGAIAVGPAKNGVQPMLSMTGANPFMTDVQIGTALGSNFIPGAKTSDTTGLLGPGFQLYDLYRGIDPFTGQAYTGAGASDAPLQRMAEGFLTSLPQAGLLQNYGYLGGKKPPKTYSPHRNDALWNYLGLPIKRVRLAKAHEYAKEGL